MNGFFLCGFVLSFFKNYKNIWNIIRKLIVNKYMNEYFDDYLIFEFIY